MRDSEIASRWFHTPELRVQFPSALSVALGVILIYHTRMPYKDIEKQRKFTANWKREQYLRQRLEVLGNLGGKCRLCGIDDLRCLEIDHIQPIFRNRESLSGVNMVKELFFKRVTYDNLQLLCANCHRIKSYEDRKKYKNYIGDIQF